LKPAVFDNQFGFFRHAQANVQRPTPNVQC
jgi:hypothetical protein